MTIVRSAQFFSPIGDAISCLAGAEWSRGLDELQLPDCGLTARDARRLAESPHLNNLRKLHLSWNLAINDEGVIALASASQLKSLEFLDLHGVLFGPDAIDALARSELAERLQLLIIGPAQRMMLKKRQQSFYHRMRDRLMCL